ncbi:MAG: S9 family peptidase [Deltaproteobacteria bacterium]|nr:S9 family peptidase [Deltaproteobacteria bacterium]
MKRLLLVLAIAACGGGGAKSSPTPPTPPAKPDPDAPPVAGDPKVVAPPAGHPRTDLIPRGIVFGNPERSNVQLSPDGKQLSWLAPKDGVMNVWVAPVGHLEKAVAVTAEATRPIRNYEWAYTNRHILYLQDTGGDENFHVHRVELATGVSTDLTPGKGARAAIARRSEKVPGSILITINDRNPRAFDVHKLDILSGKRTLVVQNDDNLAGYTFDDNLDVQFATKILPDASEQILRPELKGGKLGWTVWETLPFEDANSGVVAMAPGGKSVYFVDTRGRDTSALVTLDIATKKATKVIAEDTRADAGEVMIHPTKKDVQAVSFDYLRNSWKVIDKSIGKDLDNLAKLDGGEPRVVSRSLDDNVWLVATTSELHPANYYLWERAKQRGAFLFSSRPELDKQPLVKMHPVEIKARDGLTLVSYLSLPASADPVGDGKPNTPVPLVLWVHGGPWARDRWGFNVAHQLFANRGYAVLSVNFRGSTGFGKKFLNAGNKQWGKAMHDDLIDAVAWAVANQVTGKDQTCIGGGSYGGYATLAGVTLTPDAFRCGVDIVGPSNLITLLASIPPYWAPGLANFHMRMGNPESPEDKALMMSVSPVNHAAKIKRPLLIAQGANDPRVKQAESEQIVDAMKKAKLPVTYILFPDEGHGFARPENNIVFFGVAEAFLSAHLGGGYLPLAADELSASTIQFKEGKTGIPGLP